MRLTTACLLLAAAPVFAQSDPAIQAASQAAVRGLKAQIDQLPLSPPLPLPKGQPAGAVVTVGQYLKFVGGDDYMLATLARAQLIGGPRQLVPGGPVQVRLDIASPLVANALGQIAAVHRGISPYSPDDVLRATQFWGNRTFTATGTSTGEVVDLPAGVPAPPPPGRPPINNQPPGAALFRQPAVMPPAAPPSPPAAPAAPAAVQVAPLLPDSSQQGLMPESPAAATPPAPPAAPAGQATLTASFSAVAAEPPRDASPLAGRISLDRPPAWYFDSLDAGGSAPSVGGSKLRTARSAEEDAIANLRKQLDQLELAPGLKLADAVQQDPRLAALAPRALERARVYRIEYLEDGSVSVRVTTDPRYLWQDLAALMPPPSSR